MRNAIARISAARRCLAGSLLVVSACSVVDQIPKSPDRVPASTAGYPLEEATTHVFVRAAPSFPDTALCRERVRLGSHFPRRECITQEQIDERRIAAQRWLRTHGREGGFELIR